MRGLQAHYVAAGDEDFLVHNCGDGAVGRLEDMVDAISESTPRRQRPGTVSETVGERPSGLLVAVHSRAGAPGVVPGEVRAALEACGHAHSGCSEVSGVARVVELGAAPASVTTMGGKSKRIGAALHKQVMAPCPSCQRFLAEFGM